MDGNCDGRIVRHAGLRHRMLSGESCNGGIMKLLRHLVVFGMSLLLLAPTATASAQSDEHDTIVTAEGLEVVGFDEAVAEEHGYRIITVEGHRASVPAETANAVKTLSDVAAMGGELTADGWEKLERSVPGGPSTTAYQTSFGNCGSATLGLLDNRNATYTVDTGFDLSGGRRAVSYSWRSVVSGPGHVREFSWSGNLLARKSWRNGTGASNGRGVSVPNRGQYTATVAAGTGIAITTTGAVCSNNPLLVRQSIL